MDKRNILQIKYQDKELAKKLGAKWDNDNKCWYMDKYSKLNIIKEWFPTRRLDDFFDSSIIERFYEIPFRFSSGEEILDSLGLKRSNITKGEGSFCSMCDSSSCGNWVTGRKYCFHHVYSGSNKEEPKLSEREIRFLLEYLEKSE